jgi:FAD/FMN-containing dehydrogenase
MTDLDPLSAHRQRRDHLAAELRRRPAALHLEKRTSSNLFRYRPGRQPRGKPLWLGDFNHPLALDPQARTLDVEALITYGELVDYTLRHGFLPTVAPELKHITLGGATVGIGIESSCFRHGFVHDGLLQADVLLTDGRIVTCRPDNPYADLFHGLANSYGTLGYLLRATIRLMPARPFVSIRNVRCRSSAEYLERMQAATEDAANDFVEGLFFGPDEFYLTTGSMVDDAPQTPDIYRDVIYYKLLRAEGTFHLPTYDYIFRYDPDWFWNIPEGGVYDLFRRFAPRALRTSGFYNRYVALASRVRRSVGIKGRRDEEQLIQDWMIPWAEAGRFIDYTLENVDIQGQPWVAVPIRTPGRATNYPLEPGQLYCNIGCYCFAKKPRTDIDFHYTRILDRRCFDLGGLKMLYSSVFIGHDEFRELYNGRDYAQLKAKYDPHDRRPSLFSKVALNE